MRHTVITLLALFAVSCLSAQCYEPEARGEIVRHTCYSLSYIEEHEQPEWVYYLLKSEYVSGGVKRTDDFRPDGAVSTGSAQLSDYKGSGYDRGHLCPAGDMKQSRQAMSETFFLSNMSPQVGAFNRGVWSSLEGQVRQWALALDSVYVVTGPVFADNIGAIGASRVTVPGYYYKVLYSPARGGMMAAFLLPNASGLGKWTEYAVAVDSVEAVTGIDFFSQLPDSVEARLEAVAGCAAWLSLRQAAGSENGTSADGQLSRAVQCKGIAKSTGKRCRSMTRNANGYCNAHQSQAR